MRECYEIVLHKLDEKIMRHMSQGIHSYTELAQLCNVTRSTIYRRISRLENIKVISKKIMAIPDFAKLNLSAVCIGMDVEHEDMYETIDLLKTQPHAKFLWKTYGAHQIILVMICNKGEEGQTIFDLRETLEKKRIKNFDVSIGFSWEKIDFTPY